jgi:hypothetical protein
VYRLGGERPEVDISAATFTTTANRCCLVGCNGRIRSPWLRSKWVAPPGINRMSPSSSVTCWPPRQAANDDVVRRHAEILRGVFQRPVTLELAT